MSGWTCGSRFATLRAVGTASILSWVLVLVVGTGTALADPAPGDPGGVAGPGGGQDPTPFIGTAPFGPPRFFPANGATVGVGQPIIINFPGPVDDSGAAENAVHVSSVPPVAGKFYWMTPTQLRWRPLDFWPAHTTVTVDAGGTVSSFRTGDALVATADDATHQLTVTRNG
ncbi:MAG TPA: Ig-like domain-containing protein, partial [Mycobacterium sp.]|nr:Ig-like domain-containing protein [Mycobacterium sp.]